MSLPRVPLGQKETVPDKPGAGAADVATGGVPPVESGGEQPSPTMGEISATTYYRVDPARPDERVLGTTIREAVHRARQVDSMQSNLHKTETERNNLQTELETAHAELRSINDTLRFKEQFDKMSGNQGVPPASEAPPGVPPEDQYLYSDTPATQTPPEQRTPVTGNELANLTISDLRSLIREQVQSDQSERQTENKTEMAQNLAAMAEDRQLRETFERNRSRHMEIRAQQLRDINVTDSEIRRILDMQEQARLKEREAELLLDITGPERESALQLSELVFGEANTLFDSVVQARTDALMQYERERPQREAADLLERDAFAGVEIPENMENADAARTFNPTEIAARNKAANEKAKEISREQRRKREAAGGRSLL